MVEYGVGDRDRCAVAAAERENELARAYRSNGNASRDKAINDLQTALDLLVGQAAAGSGLKITAVNSQLDQATLQKQRGAQAGSGQWTVTAQDDKGQAITLQGR